MQCPLCGSINTFVKDSRASAGKSIIKRRRSCNNCKNKFSTVEHPQLRSLFVVKKTGAKRPFDRNKITAAINMAARKRNLNSKSIEEMIEQIVRTLENSSSNVISTKKIGEIIMNALATKDEVACIRFASVYKDFNSAQDFAKFIKAQFSSK